MRIYGWGLLSVMLSAFLLACGGGSSGGDGTDGDGTAGDEDFDEDGFDDAGDTVTASAVELIGINPPETPWSDMSHEEREFDMIGRFHPIYRELFQQHDAERWAEFGCENCHGPNGSETNFAMPSDHLPPVPAPGSESYNRARGVLTDMYTFMEEQVTANMTTMLGQEVTCQSCHPSAG